jgi:hypothetical protein
MHRNTQDEQYHGMIEFLDDPERGAWTFERELGTGSGEMRRAASGDERHLQNMSRRSFECGDAALPKNRQQDGSIALGDARTVLYAALLLPPICHEPTCTLLSDGLSQWPATGVCGNITQVNSVYLAVISPRETSFGTGHH